jgi:serine/threonine protein kinase
MPETQNEATGLIEPGTILSDYQIAERIGEGAIAEIYRARQIKLDRDVAIKVLKYQEDWDPETVKLLEHEAKTIARLNHPNIVQVIDCGTYKDLYYFVMEYVDGTDFKYIMKEGLYDLSQKLDAIVQTLKALEYAHNNGIVHRDIKPANLLISSEGHLKVADFGIAIVGDKSDQTDTDTTSPMGTPAYMAPEQWKCQGPVDKRADLYSVGVMLYEVLTSKRPSESPPAPSEISSNAPAEFDRIVLKCLEVDPTKRYQSAAEVKNQLLAASTGLAYTEDISMTGGVRNAKRKAGLSLSDKYTHLDTLHESPFGATYLVKNTKNDTLYIVKVLCRDVAGIKEANVIAQLRHPNLIRIYGAGSDKERGIVISEYAQGGSLADRLVRVYQVDEALEIFKQIASGLSYAHRNGIIHGNLRPSNVLFDSNDRVKLADFALPEHYLRKRSNWYGAPEREKSVAYDIYSTGVLFYQLLTGRIPDIRSGGDLAWKSKSRDGRFSLLNVISQMLERDPARRPPSFEAILNHISTISGITPGRTGSPVPEKTVLS